MIRIAGGTYSEFCIEPPWEQLMGSGVRAAIALGELSDRTYLTTYIGERDRQNLQSQAAQFNFEIQAEIIPTTVMFHYYHGLSEPDIRPAPQTIQQAPLQNLEAANILRFGFIEGDVLVHGERVVYDPQNISEPRGFRENGSTANRLAIVANLAECIKLAGTQYQREQPELLGQAILKAEEAEVVVIKRGSFGATVITGAEARNIPAYRTERVWPIGSGDVFAAVFAHYWASGNADAFEAAKLASLSTAFYCQNGMRAIPRDITDIFHPDPVMSKDPFLQKQVYLAAPFFTMPQRRIVEESRKHLADQGFKVFSPFHDVGYGTASEVVPADVKGVRQSDVLFAIVDGLDPGTLFEIGYARALDKPVIAFVQNESENALKMLEGSDCEIVGDFVSAIYRTTWAAMSL